MLNSCKKVYMRKHTYTVTELFSEATSRGALSTRICMIVLRIYVIMYVCMYVLFETPQLPCYCCLIAWRTTRSYTCCQWLKCILTWAFSLNASCTSHCIDYHIHWTVHAQVDTGISADFIQAAWTSPLPLLPRGSRMPAIRTLHSIVNMTICAQRYIV